MLYSFNLIVGSPGPELVLRLSNVHPWWRGRLESEVAVMKFVKDAFPQMPVPTVLKCQPDSGVSEFGAGYVIMEKMKGVSLSDIVTTIILIIFTILDTYFEYTTKARHQ